MRPLGNWERSFTDWVMSPVSTSVSSLVSSVLPIPGSSVTFPSRVSCSTETEDSRTVLAAVR